MKNIVVCSDGTQNEVSDYTNVVKLFRCVEDHTPAQVAFYDPGVGTSNWGAIESATGLGITGNIMDAYTYLMDFYEDGDRIFLFGFSRGAYTVRSLGGMLGKCGLLPKGSVNLRELALKIYRARGNKEEARDFKQHFSRTCHVYFVGVWDTVGALGFASWPLMNKINPYDTKFHDTTLNATVPFGYHALAIDDQRKTFHPVLWDESTKLQGQTIEQVWFAGMHSDVGGGYKEQGVSDVALTWILNKAVKQGLRLTGTSFPFINPNISDKLHDSREGMGNLYLKKARELPAGARIHVSVRERMSQPGLGYRPLNLPSGAVFVDDDGNIVP